MKMDCWILISIILILNHIFGGMGLAFTILKLPSGCKNGVGVIPRMDRMQNPYTTNLDELWQSLSMENFL